MADKVAYRRVYEQISPQDGRRVLVDRIRLWDMRKEDAHLDKWMCGVAPTRELRKWYSHEPSRFDPDRPRTGSGPRRSAEGVHPRNHVLECLAEAACASSPRRRRAALTFGFVGGGFAGLKALAELQDLARDTPQHYPAIQLRHTGRPFHAPVGP